MKPRHVKWMLAAACIVWVLPWEAKRLFPDGMGTWYVQWPLVLCVVMLLSLSMFFSLRDMVLCPAERRTCALVFALGILVVCVNIGMYGIMSGLLGQYNGWRYRIAVTDVFRSCLDMLPKVQTAEGRETLAKSMYGLFGIAMPYWTGDHVYVSYRPDEEAKAQWLQTQQKDARIEQTTTEVAWQIKQMTGLSLLLLSGMVAACCSAAIVIVRRTPGHE